MKMKGEEMLHLLGGIFLLVGLAALIVYYVVIALILVWVFSSFWIFYVTESAILTAIWFCCWGYVLFKLFKKNK